MNENNVTWEDIPLYSFFLLEAEHERYHGNPVFTLMFKDNDKWYNCTNLPVYSSIAHEAAGGKGYKMLKNHLPIWKYPKVIKSHES